MKKETLKLNIDKNKTIDLLLKDGSGGQKIIEMVKKGVRGPFNYFNSVKTIKFGIELIYSRKEFDQKMGHKTKEWITAYSFGNRFILFGPSEIEKYTNHNRNEFMQIISHETSHILLKKLNNAFCAWMNEGIAQNISGQERKEKINPKNTNYFLNKCLFKNSNYERFISRQGYEISYRLVRFLLTNYSKVRIMRLLQIKYDFVKSSEKNICRILNTDKDKLMVQFKEILKNPQ